jgi:hypothetical protein
MNFGHLEQKLELRNQNMCKKFLKNNAHIRVIKIRKAIFWRYQFDGIMTNIFQ